MSFVSTVGSRLAPRLGDVAPELTANAIREALHRAIEGFGPLQGAAATAEAHLAAQDGDRDRAIHEVVEHHVRLAGAQGFATNIGGILTAAITIPANLAGLAVIKCRMVAAIAHLRGYDLDDPRTHDAVLACLLGESEITKLIESRALPAPPMALATAPARDPGVQVAICAEVARGLVSSVAGKRLAVQAARRVPVVGGVVGLGADAYDAWRAGRYAEREFLPRARR